MSLSTYFHIGFVVPDIEKAMAHYSKVLGVKFTRPSNMTSYVTGPDNVTYEQDVVAVYSRSKAPYYELIQASGDGIYSEKYANQIFYFGIWESNMEQRLKTMAEQGIGAEAIMRTKEDGPPIAIITEPDIMGSRIEYVSTTLWLPVKAWVLTGYPI